MELIQKKCTECEISKDLKEFHNSKIGLYGVKSVCKTCLKNRYVDTKDVILKNKKEYYIINKDEIIKRNIAYRKNKQVK